MRTKDKANNMVLNRGSSRRELARVGICGDVIGDNKEDINDNKNKDDNKNVKENKDKAVDAAVLPHSPSLTHHSL